VITEYRWEGRRRLAASLGRLATIRARSTTDPHLQGPWRPTLVRTWSCVQCPYTAVIAGTEDSAAAVADAHREREHRRQR